MHYTWYVPHDQEGLINLMGGEENYLARLDSMFTEDYYWHGNEPGHQIPFLFNYAGAPWMTQKYTRKLFARNMQLVPEVCAGTKMQVRCQHGICLLLPDFILFVPEYLNMCLEVRYLIEQLFILRMEIVLLLLP